MENETRIGGWIQTFSDVKFYPLDVRPGDIVLADIVHALSHQCRYGGHSAVFYSVAEHSVLLANWVYGETQDPRLAMAALMHDAAEAYLVDIPSPIKKMLPEYVKMEKQLEEAIFAVFDIRAEDIAKIKPWDTAIVMDERRVLFEKEIPWESDCEPLGVQLRALAPENAAAVFAVTYATLRLKMMRGL